MRILSESKSQNVTPEKVLETSPAQRISSKGKSPQLKGKSPHPREKVWGMASENYFREKVSSAQTKFWRMNSENYFPAQVFSAQKKFWSELVPRASLLSPEKVLDDDL